MIGQVTAPKVGDPQGLHGAGRRWTQVRLSPAEAGAIKDYVEGGGSALFMLDTPVRIGAQEGSENPEAGKDAGRLGRHCG